MFLRASVPEPTIPSSETQVVLRHLSAFKYFCMCFITGLSFKEQQQAITKYSYVMLLYYLLSVNLLRRQRGWSLWENADG